MFNRFAMKQSFSKNNNDRINPFRVKRTYNTMLEQNHSIPTTISFGTKKLKLNDARPSESLIRHNKPKIPEKFLREIELYNSQRYSYNRKITYCPCQE